MNKITIGEVSIAPTRMSRIGDGLIVLGLRFPDDAGFPVALVPTQRQDIATAQSCIRSKLDDRSQIPTNIFGGVKKPLVFVGAEIPDNLIIRTEHPNLTNRILVKDPLNIAPVEECVKHTEILIDRCLAYLFHPAQCEFLNCCRFDSCKRTFSAELVFDGVE